MLIVAASLGAELADLEREVEASQSVAGRQPPLEFHILGVGPGRAGEAMTEILAERSNKNRGVHNQVDGVLLLGIAGASATELETGNLLLARHYALDTALDTKAGQAEPLKPNGRMLELAEQAAIQLAMPANRGASVTVDHLVRETGERHLLRERYGADSINMEDYRVAEAAAKANVPFLAVRVVLDTANQRLPAYLEGLSSSRYGLIAKILGMPWRIPTMLRLKNQLMLCQAVIARFGLAYLELDNERRQTAEAQAAGRALY